MIVGCSMQDVGLFASNKSMYYEALCYDGSQLVMPSYFVFDEGILESLSAVNLEFSQSLLSKLRRILCLSEDDVSDYKLIENIYININQKLGKLRDFDIPCFWV